MEFKTIKEVMYEKAIMGVSAVSGGQVEIIGEAVIEYEGRILEQYIYNIVGYTAENGKPFSSLKANIELD